MVRLHEILGRGERTTATETPHLFLFIYQAADHDANETLSRLLNEGRREQDLGRRWSLAWDSAHVPSGKPHVHVYLRGAALYAVNRDGTGHDGSSGLEIHNEPLAAIQRKWPEVKKLIESAGFQGMGVLIPADVMERALAVHP
ncbi:hypothetical protein [Phaeospirillum tilakii]|uniref:Uncharacterized protein n=1 Tax=Phaeospirillum tilakii TaxID=741673 RepID=A0ABW5CGA0_9PROT